MKRKRLYRSRDNRVIAGVAGGLGAYLEIDPTIVRLLFVIALIIGLAPTIAVYLAGWLLIPDEPVIT
ncbi:MAG TPA: PspC domain-containing protein [Chloroflexota bacterium]|jgi:phage shock protein C|nr:PspC domain-containing protein [Chloroflexota bacterium]